jgi:uncharacterized spore protein YtfJ
MSDETNPMEFEDDFDEFDDDLFVEDRDQLIEAAEGNVDAFLNVASVDAVYGEAVEHRDTLMIPAAEVVAVMGFGMGRGLDESERGPSSGTGAGGGGRVFSRPVAVIISTPDGVRVEPVYDWTKVIMAGVAALAFIFGMNRRFRKMRRAVEKMD